MDSTRIIQPIQILVITGKSGDAGALEEQLADAAPMQFVMDTAPAVEEACALIRKRSFGIILLDISAHNGGGFGAFTALREAAGEIPIVVLTDLDDEATAVRAVQEGAQDYIVRGHVNTKHLAHSLLYAIARQSLLEKLVNDSFVDVLTGLYNRRGFVTMGQQQLHMAQRSKRGLMLFFVDMDGLKQVNDSYGHVTGDQALVETGQILSETFRKSDIIARIGGDEFAVLAVETAQKNRDLLLKRLDSHIGLHNQQEGKLYQLSVSIGVADYDPQTPCSIYDLIGRADELMYEKKRAKKG